MTDAERPSHDIAYLEAIDELDTILAELDADTIDVDELATKVARASELIELCRSRITDADLQVQEITEHLDSARPDGSGGEPDDDAVDEP